MSLELGEAGRENWKQKSGQRLVKAETIPDWVTDGITADTKNCLRWLEEGGGAMVDNGLYYLVG